MSLFRVVLKKSSKIKLLMVICNSVIKIIIIITTNKYKYIKIKKIWWWVYKE